MKVYELLQALEAEGRLNGMFRCGLLQPHLKKWMQIYAFSLEHADMSYVEISTHFEEATKSTIGRALVFMNQELNWSSRDCGTRMSE